MKMKMLLALGLCFALTFPLLAQENKLQDSVYITPFAGCKIVLVGKSIQKLLQENNLEVLKNKFIEDYNESANDKDFPADAKNIIYLASQDGRRRLKALPDEGLQLSIENEIQSFKSDLPPFHYTIYDLSEKFEYHIYVKEPANLEQLKTLDCIKLLTDATRNKLVIQKRYVSIEISNSDTGFTIKKQNGNAVDLLSLSGFIGVGLINSSLTPTIGFDVDFVKINKYSKSNFKIGAGYSFNIFTNYENKKFSNFYSVQSTDIHFLKNISPKKDEYWLGLSAGKYFDTKQNGSQNGSLNKAWKFGIVTQFKSIGVSYDFIYDKNKNRNAGITFRYYF